MLKHSFTMFDWELVTVSSCSRNSPISISSVIVFMCAKPTRINILQGYCWCMLLSPSPLCCTDHSPLLKAGCGDDGCWKQIHRKLAMGDPANRANRANDRITGQFQIIFVRYRNLLNQGHVVTCVDFPRLRSYVRCRILDCPSLPLCSHLMQDNDSKQYLKGFGVKLWCHYFG